MPDDRIGAEITIPKKEKAESCWNPVGQMIDEKRLSRILIAEGGQPRASDVITAASTAVRLAG
jgi:hypothetical protein